MNKDSIQKWIRDANAIIALIGVVGEVANYFEGLPGKVGYVCHGLVALAFVSAKAEHRLVEIVNSLLNDTDVPEVPPVQPTPPANTPTKINIVMPIILVLGLAMAGGASAQAPTNTTSAPVTFQLPKLTLAQGTNTLGHFFSKIELAGVESISWGDKTIDRGGISVEYVIDDWQWKDYLCGRWGIATVQPSDFSRSYIGLATTVSVVKGGSLDAKLHTLPILDLVGKMVEFGDYYVFIEAGSQVDRLNGQISFGAGAKIW